MTEIPGSAYSGQHSRNSHGQDFLSIQVIKRRISPRQQLLRDNIVACARELIAIDGANISMEAVAENSGTSRSTLYRYFGSREHLIAEVTLDAGNRLIELLGRHPPAGNTLGERIESLCLNLTRMAETNSTLLACCVTNITSEDPAVIDLQSEIEQLVSGIFKSVRGDTELRNQASVDRTLFRYLLGAFLLATTGKLEFDELAGELTEFCHSLMLDHWDDTAPTAPPID